MPIYSDPLAILSRATNPIRDPDENPTPTPEPEPESRIPQPNPEALTAVPTVPGLYRTQQGVPLWYLTEEDAPYTRTTIGPDGFVWAGDFIVAHWSDADIIRPAQEMPKEITPSIIHTCSNALIHSGIFVYNDVFHIETFLPGGVRKLTPIRTLAGFDGILALATAWYRVKYSKDPDEDPTYYVAPMTERIVKMLNSSPELKEALPKIHKVNSVQIPYRPFGSECPLLNPLGFNPENGTYTLGECIPEGKMTDEEWRVALKKPTGWRPGKKRLRTQVRPDKVDLKKWHRDLTDTFVWKEAIDYDAFVAQSMSAYVWDLLTPTKEDGTRGTVAVVPASLVDSNRAGSGKSLLTKLGALAVHGDVRAQVPDRKEEVSAFIVSAIQGGRSCLFLDEAKTTMCEQLLTAISDGGAGRVKGESTLVDGDLHILLAAVNPTYTEMMARRVLVCKITTREDFLTHAFGEKTVTKSNIEALRPRMLAWCQHLFTTWVDAGMPLGPDLPQWPEYARLVGGILEANGYMNPLSLRNAAATYEGNDNHEAHFPEFFRFCVEHGASFTDPKEDIEGSYQIEGSHLATDILRRAQTAGYYQDLPINARGSRDFLGYLSPWMNMDIPLHGYTMSKKPSRDGVKITFKKID